MTQLKELAPSIKKRLGGNWHLKLIVTLGLAGMAMILFSQFTSNKKPPSQVLSEQDARQISQSYANELENRLTELISGMQGAGETRVMITLENIGETIYAQEEKRNVDKQQEANEQAVGKTFQKENVEQKYIIIDGENGREALVRTKLEPKIQGVVVMCEGAKDLNVQQAVTHVVTTALNIPTTRVCVVKISK